MDELIEVSDQLINTTDLMFKRYLYSTVDWSENLTGISGRQ